LGGRSFDILYCGDDKNGLVLNTLFGTHNSLPPIGQFTFSLKVLKPMSQAIVKVFNTAGPGVAEEHYLLPVLERQPGINEMIEGEYYFALHAPRRSGKTTLLNALTNKINSEGKYYALTCSIANLKNVADRAQN
jgi:hypothetical protein